MGSLKTIIKFSTTENTENVEPFIHWKTIRVGQKILKSNVAHDNQEEKQENANAVIAILWEVLSRLLYSLYLAKIMKTENGTLIGWLQKECGGNLQYGKYGKNM